ncbi:BON domain-containing protein [bacterium]|nr:BON domain-containing protein [bacterium]
MKKPLIYLMLTTILAAGCSQSERNNMANQTNQGLREASQTVKQDLHKAGRAVDEGLSSTRIKSALMASRKLDASHINVDTEKKTVYLRGSVKTQEQKKIARDLTNTMIEPGQKLVDELKIAANPDENQAQ